MDNATYTTVSRQRGLLREMSIVAQNLANMSTTGYRAEGIVFSEVVRSTGPGEHSLSMASARTGITSSLQGTLSQTGAALDLAIEGPGYFLVSDGDRGFLTRAGHFLRNAEGGVVTPAGYALLDEGGAPVVLPPEAAAITVASDGTIAADGAPVARLGLWGPPEGAPLTRREGVLFAAEGEPVPAEFPGAVVQGFLENANVDPVSEVARMIEVQRAYEMGQGLLDREDERIRSMLSAMSR